MYSLSVRPIFFFLYIPSLYYHIIILILSDSIGIGTHNHLVCKQILNYSAKLVK